MGIINCLYTALIKLRFTTFDKNKIIYLKFLIWYRFIFKNQPLINMGTVDLVYLIIANNLSSYMGPVFEEILPNTYGSFSYSIH